MRASQEHQGRLLKDNVKWQREEEGRRPHRSSERMEKALLSSQENSKQEIVYA